MRSKAMLIRFTALALGVYACGGPQFEGMRPELVDKPLTFFHRDINAAVNDGLRLVGGVERMPGFGFIERTVRTRSVTEPEPAPQRS